MAKAQSDVCARPSYCECGKDETKAEQPVKRSKEHIRKLRKLLGIPTFDHPKDYRYRKGQGK